MTILKNLKKSEASGEETAESKTGTQSPLSM
jgi:hypothetical protein